MHDNVSLYDVDILGIDTHVVMKRQKHSQSKTTLTGGLRKTENDRERVKDEEWTVVVHVEAKSMNSRSSIVYVVPHRKNRVGLLLQRTAPE